MADILSVAQVDLLFAIAKMGLYDILKDVVGETAAASLMAGDAVAAAGIVDAVNDLETAYIADKAAWVQVQGNIDLLDNQVDAFVAIEKDDLANLSSEAYTALQAASPEA